MFFPLKGDEKFLKNLKKGTPLYLSEIEWNPDKGEMEVIVKSIFFDHYETKKVAAGDDDSVILAVLTKGGIQTESHNIAYGFYETPMKALESQKQLYQAGLNATEKAMKDEDKRLQKLVKKAIKSSKTIGKTGHVSPKVDLVEAPNFIKEEN